MECLIRLHKSIKLKRRASRQDDFGTPERTSKERKAFSNFE
jgi:hypothetical protein